MLEVSNVDAGYGETQILYDVNITLDAEENVTILGPNGAGKTTLLRVISGAITPTTGTITLDGKSIEGKEPQDTADLGLIHVPQEQAIFSDMVVHDNLLVGSYLPRAREKREESLELVYELFPRLDDRREQLAGTLSGGERKMLAIGKGLMSDPDMLMLDEPSSGLAPNLVEQVFESIHEIRDQTNMPILLVEQRTSQALDFADRAYVLENGRIRLEETTEALLERDDLDKLYLGG